MKTFKDLYVETIKKCENCKHYDSDVTKYPCNLCDRHKNKFKSTKQEVNDAS